MTEKSIAWLRAKVDECSPQPVLAEIGSSVASLAELVTQLRGAARTATLFGMAANAEVVARARVELLPTAEAALVAWKQRLVAEHGDEGAKAFADITLRYGLALDPLPALRRDPKISAALGRLFAALADVDRATANAVAAGSWLSVSGQRLAYYVARTSDPVGFAQLGLEPAPSDLEGLYAEIDGLVIDSSDRGGETDQVRGEGAVFDAVARAELVDIEDAECVLLSQGDMGLMRLYRLDDGAVLEWLTKFDEHPRLIAPSLVAYLDQLTAVFAR
jgi:hypothetical protein